MNDKRSRKEVTRRILMSLGSASAVDHYISRLRQSGCKKIDASRVVNSILEVFFFKYAEKSFKEIQGQFFDKKGYLLKLINDSSNEDIDANVASYFQEIKPRKRRGRKPKANPVENNDEIESA